MKAKEQNRKVGNRDSKNTSAIIYLEALTQSFRSFQIMSKRSAYRLFLFPLFSLLIVPQFGDLFFFFLNFLLHIRTEISYIKSLKVLIKEDGKPNSFFHLNQEATSYYYEVPLKQRLRDFPVVQLLGPQLSAQAQRVPSGWVAKISHASRPKKKRNYIVTNSIKTLKMIHIKKQLLKFLQLNSVNTFISISSFSQWNFSIMNNI